MRFICHFLIISTLLFQTACGPFKYKPVDARNVPSDPKERVKKNIEEGRGFRIMGGSIGKTTYDFASSNPLWRASLDILDFMPLTNANYSGGIIISDWYSEKGSQNESIKISVRFLTNEIRSDALDIKVFYKKCDNISNCKITEQEGNLKVELNKEILKKAAVYKEQQKDNTFKPYDSGGERDNKT